jgi:CHAD domain-containing protein
LSEEGAPISQIAQDLNLSVTTVNHWRREWRKRRLEAFPSPAAAQLMTAADDSPAEMPEPRPGIDVARLPLALAPAVGMLPNDSMAEAGRKSLLFNFERMLYHEPGSRAGVDIEAVHDMRVATRRMRSAIRLFGPFFEPGALKPFNRELRRIARGLGAVRDLDVFIDNAQKYAGDGGDHDLSPLLSMWEKRRSQARRELIARLDSENFAHFVDDFHAFLTTPGAGAAPIRDGVTAYQVRHVAPRLLYERYEQVRAYETVLHDASAATLHALRIDFKRFRYALEFFAEVLGPEVKAVVEETKRMQDHLGELNDTEVVGNALRALVDRHYRKYSGVPIFMRPNVSGVLDYAQAQAALQQRLRDTFPEAWTRFNQESVRRDLALAVAAL